MVAFGEEALRCCKELEGESIDEPRLGNVELFPVTSECIEDDTALCVCSESPWTVDLTLEGGGGNIIAPP